MHTIVHTINFNHNFNKVNYGNFKLYISQRI